MVIIEETSKNAAFYLLPENFKLPPGLAVRWFLRHVCLHKGVDFHHLQARFATLLRMGGMEWGWMRHCLV